MSEPKLVEWARFGERVRSLRRQSGLSLAELADRTNFSPTYLGKIENATRRPNRNVSGALDRELRTDGALLREWSEALRSESSPEWYEQSRAYEKRATEIRFFHPFVIPGFFQTPDYARIVVSHSKPDAYEQVINRAIATRSAWYRDLRETNLRLNVVIPEMVLRHRVGSPDVMHHQIDRLVDESDGDLTTIQVLPEATADYAWTAGAFRIIRMADGRTMLCVEHAFGEMLSDESTQIRWLESVFSKIQTWALPPNASVDLMKEIRSP